MGVPLGLLLLQAAAIGLLLRESKRLGQGWATAAGITAAASAALFLVPSAIYVADGGYLDVGSRDSAVAVATVSMLALLAGYVLARPDRGRPVEVVPPPSGASPGAALAVFAVGFLGLGVLMLNAGGPAAYLSNIGETAGTNAGLFYVVAVSLALRFGPVAYLTVRWASGLPASRFAIGLLAAGLLLLGVTGARSFVAVAAVELVVLYALLRRPIPLVRLLAVGGLAAVILVFGAGAAKRYSNYVERTPDARPFASYMVRVAPSEALDAYVNNYVDTVRLMALAEATVPERAPYEGLRPLEQLLLKPIPSGLRPTAERQPVIKQAFEPGGGSAYAEPLQVTAYLAAGLPAVSLAFLLLGLLVARVDRWLMAGVRRPPWQIAAAVMLAVQVPVLMRSGIPNGAAFLGVEVAGTALATVLVAGQRFRRIDDGLRATRALLARLPAQVGHAWSGARAAVRRAPVDPEWRAWGPVVAVAAFAIALVTAAVAASETPALATDSAGYLANARYLAGAGVRTQELGDVYAIGSSLLLVLPYLVSDSWRLAYEVGLVLNAAYVAVAVTGVFVIVRTWFAGTRRQAAAAGLIVGAMPLVALPAAYLWAEPLLVALVVWWAIAVRAWTVGGTRRDGLLLGLLSVASYLTHHRMVSVLIVGLGLLAFRRETERRTRAVVLGVVFLVAGLALVLEGAVRDAVYVDPPRTGSQFESLRLGDAPEIVVRMVGASWATSLGTLALAAVGVAVLLRSTDMDRRVRLALGVATLGGLVVSSAFLQHADAVTPVDRADWLTYERYVAPWAVTLAAVGAGAWLTGRRLPWRWIGAALLAGTGLLFATSGTAPAGAVAVPNVLGIAGFAGLAERNPDGALSGTLPLGAAALAAAVVAVVVLAVRVHRVRVVLVALVGLLAVVSGTQRSQTFQDTFDGTGRSIAAALARVPDDQLVAFDLATSAPDELNSYQLFDPGQRVRLFHSEKGQEPRAGLVLAGPGWGQASRLGADPVAVASTGAVVLWRVGRPLGGPSPAAPPTGTDLLGYDVAAARLSRP